jgi:hypothetical protein
MEIGGRICLPKHPVINNLIFRNHLEIGHHFSMGLGRFFISDHERVPYFILQKILPGTILETKA